MRSNAILLLFFAMFMDTGTATWGPIGMEPYGDPYGVNKYRDPLDEYAGAIARSCELAVEHIANKEVRSQFPLFKKKPPGCRITNNSMIGTEDR